MKNLIRCTTLSLVCLSVLLSASSAGAQISDVVVDGPLLIPEKLVRGALTESDPTIQGDGSPFKAYRLEVQAEQSYQITYSAVDDESGLDPLLLLFNEQGRLLNLNDDYTEDGQNLDARLVFTADEDGVLIVYANSVMIDTYGAFTLLVELVETPENALEPASSGT